MPPSTAVMMMSARNCSRSATRRSKWRRVSRGARFISEQLLVDDVAVLVQDLNPAEGQGPFPGVFAEDHLSELVAVDALVLFHGVVVLEDRHRVQIRALHVADAGGAAGRHDEDLDGVLVDDLRADVLTGDQMRRAHVVDLPQDRFVELIGLDAHDFSPSMKLASSDAAVASRMNAR